MTTPDWVQDAVFYQIFPDRFARSERMPDLGFEPWDAPPTYHGFKGGDLYGIVERMDYLSNLGITALDFNPVFASYVIHHRCPKIVTYVLAAAFVGGASAAGGVGKVVGSIIGALVITSLTSGMNLMGIDISYQYIVRSSRACWCCGI